MSLVIKIKDRKKKSTNTLTQNGFESLLIQFTNKNLTDIWKSLPETNNLNPKWFLKFSKQFLQVYRLDKKNSHQNQKIKQEMLLTNEKNQKECYGRFFFVLMSSLISLKSFLLEILRLNFDDFGDQNIDDLSFVISLQVLKSMTKYFAEYENMLIDFGLFKLLIELEAIILEISKKFTLKLKTLKPTSSVLQLSEFDYFLFLLTNHLLIELNTLIQILIENPKLRVQKKTKSNNHYFIGDTPILEKHRNLILKASSIYYRLLSLIKPTVFFSNVFLTILESTKYLLSISSLFQNGFPDGTLKKLGSILLFDPNKINKFTLDYKNQLIKNKVILYFKEIIGNHSQWKEKIASLLITEELNKFKYRLLIESLSICSHLISNQNQFVGFLIKGSFSRHFYKQIIWVFETFTLTKAIKLQNNKSNNGNLHILFENNNDNDKKIKDNDINNEKLKKNNQGKIILNKLNYPDKTKKKYLKK